MATAEAMRQAIHITCATQMEHSRLVVVTSALAGVTDLLLETAHAAAEGDVQRPGHTIEALRARHMALAGELVARDSLGHLEAQIAVCLAELAGMCQQIGAAGEASPRLLDAASGMGERLSARVLSAALQAAGKPSRWVDATRLIVTDDHFGAANPQAEATRRRARGELLPLLARGIVPVVTGFIAATPQGAPVTLGRGGSDYSAAILGAALPASEVWIWTDVDGVMTADPRWVPAARTIPELSYAEAEELAASGAKVLHPRTVAPLVEAGIGLRVCNTFHPERPGTRLRQALPAGGPGAIKAISAREGIHLGDEAATPASTLPATGAVATVTAVGPAAGRAPGVARSMRSALERGGIELFGLDRGRSGLSLRLFIPAAKAIPAVQALHSLVEGV